MFTRKTEPAAPAKESARPSVVPGPSNRTFMPMQSGALLSRGVSIKGSVKFLNELLIDGEVKAQSIPPERSRSRSTRAYAVRSGRNR